MEKEEKEKLANEVKASIKGEIQEDVAKIQKLIADKFEELRKGHITEGEFKTFAEKTDANLAEIETKLNRPELFGKTDTKQISPEEKAFSGWLKKGVVAPEEQKVMKISDDTAGGYVAPIEFSQRMITKLVEISPIRQIALVETIGGPGIEFPKEGTDTVTAAWEDEALVAGDFKFKMEKLEPKELKALVTVKKTLLEDAYFDLEAYLIRKTAEKFQQKEGVGFISGNGVGKPEGILTHADIVSVVSGDASVLKPDGIINLVYELPEPYARNARFIMRRKTIGAIRLFKDQNNQYIWQPSYQAGQPETILGFPTVAAPDMPAIASNSYPILFGDFRAGYQIVDRINVEVQRLVEVYATQGLVGFLFRKRTDAQVILAEAIVKQKVAAS